MTYTRLVRTTIWSEPPPPARTRSLGRAEIVTAAIALADESGAPALTMKALAARLGDYSPMALYRYVHSKDGLIDLMLDTATGTVPLPTDPDHDWRVTLHAIATDTRRMIGRHPWYAALVHTRPPIGPHAMRRTEAMLAALTAHGATVGQAMTFAALLDRHVFGSSLQEAQEARFNASAGLDSPAKLTGAVRQVHALAEAVGSVPLLASWLAHPVTDSPEAQFELGLGFLLDGIATAVPGRAAVRRRRAPKI